MTPRLQQLNTDLDRIIAEVKSINDQWAGRRMGDTDDGRAAAKRRDELATEGAQIQDAIDSEIKADNMLARAGRMAARTPDGVTADTDPTPGVAGYVSLGHAVIGSSAFAEYVKSGYARGNAAVVQLADVILSGRGARRGSGGETLVPLTAEQCKAYTAFFATKTAPTLGAGVIAPERVDRLPQVTADQRLGLRDVIASGTTSAGSIEYVREDSVTGDAAVQVPGQPKAELSVTYSLQTAPVRTIAAWMPVQNQQLEDWAQLGSLIDGRLTYKVKLEEERQVFFGDGAGNNLTGILNTVGIQNIATNGRYNGATHTLIDVVRMGITDIFTAGYNANAVALDPRDWETILLEKGNDERYVWAVVTTDNGQRLWALPIIESVGLTSTDPDEVGRREVLVGDFAAGAQLIDRAQLTVQVGLVNDQFTRNMRTILAEERIALPVYAPKAFAHFATEAGAS